MNDDLTIQRFLPPNENTCPNCKHVNPAGVFICHNCGTLLAQENQFGSTRSIEQRGATAEQVAALDEPSPYTPGNTVQLILREGREPIEIKVTPQKMRVGRRDLSNNYTPEIDLYAYAALLLGVSRQHAFMYAQDDKLYLQDNGSHNGTYVNHKRLDDGQVVALTTGDDVRMGELRFIINF